MDSQLRLETRVRNTPTHIKGDSARGHKERCTAHNEIESVPRTLCRGGFPMEWHKF